MKRILLLITVAAVMAAMIVAMAAPAFAAPQRINDKACQGSEASGGKAAPFQLGTGEGSCFVETGRR